MYSFRRHKIYMNQGDSRSETKDNLITPQWRHICKGFRRFRKGLSNSITTLNFIMTEQETMTLQGGEGGGGIMPS